MVRFNYFRVCAVFTAAIAMAVLSALLVTNAKAIGGCDGPSACGPSVARTVPSDGDTRVDRDRNIRAYFFAERPLLESTINGQTIRLYTGRLTYEQLNPTCGTSGCQPPQPVSATVTYNAEKKLGILNPGARLAKRTAYTALVEGAGDSDGLAVKDSMSLAIEDDVIWYFKTGRR